MVALPIMTAGWVDSMAPFTGKLKDGSDISSMIIDYKLLPIMIKKYDGIPQE